LPLSRKNGAWSFGSVFTIRFSVLLKRFSSSFGAAVFLIIDHLRGHEDIAAALGNMIVAWSGAEQTLVHAMANVSGMDINQANKGFYRIPTFESRVKFILGIIPGWRADDNQKQELTKAIEALSGLAAARNSWVHNSWVEDIAVGGGGVFVINERAAPGKPWHKEVKAHDINHHTETVIKRTNELRALLTWPEPDSSPDRPPQPDDDKTDPR
jgi:hypothetical protein